MYNPVCFRSCRFVLPLFLYLETGGVAPAETWHGFPESNFQNHYESGSVRRENTNTAVTRGDPHHIICTGRFFSMLLCYDFGDWTDAKVAPKGPGSRFVPSNVRRLFAKIFGRATTSTPRTSPATFIQKPCCLLPRISSTTPKTPRGAPSSTSFGGQPRLVKSEI